MTNPQQNSPFDAAGRNYEPFFHIPSGSDLQAFRRWMKANFPGAQAGFPGGFMIGVIGLVICVPWAAISLLGLVGSAVLDVDRGAGAGFLLLPVGAVVFFIYLMKSSSRRAGEGMFKLSEFARINGYVFTGMTRDATYPGMIFHRGRNRRALARVHSRPGERFFDIGTQWYTVGQGKEQQDVALGYMVFQVDRMLPHIVLDSRQNNSRFLGVELSTVPEYIRHSRVLSLEGDFNRYFTLYCPPGYERDALYIFTPDLMALLIDHSASFDMEVVDDLIFLYSAKPFHEGDQALLRRAFGILDHVAPLAARQTRYYSDDATGQRTQNLVAEPGRRLGRTGKGIAITVGIPVVVYGIWIISEIMTLAKNLAP